MADGAQYIVDYCTRMFSGKDFIIVSEQVFQSTGWNAIVKEDTESSYLKNRIANGKAAAIFEILKKLGQAIIWRLLHDLLSLQLCG
ncbi:import inner membrane translocase subunit tim-21 [Purpureocillium lavendulum]|uniref:Import inner membrane translocase subunit tim-21 n=1 Tax=Purpureocillium lavendulum TaxID=1247861 RepID=A0AB34FZP5_9HYPO|nr:import inner membrane translocase subunit tim-21 [Purpureocillium lavendulum]